MQRTSIIVRADWDAEANVWVATSADIGGLALEGDTLEALTAKLCNALPDLIKLNEFAADASSVPVHLVADRLLRLPAQAA